MIALKIVKWIISWKKVDFADLVKDAKSAAGFSTSYPNFESDGMTSHKRDSFKSRSQPLSSLPPLVVGRKTLVAAGHVSTCDTNFPTGVESTNNFCRSQLQRKEVDRWSSTHGQIHF